MFRQAVWALLVLVLLQHSDAFHFSSIIHASARPAHTFGGQGVGISRCRGAYMPLTLRSMADNTVSDEKKAPPTISFAPAEAGGAGLSMARRLTDDKVGDVVPDKVFDDEITEGKEELGKLGALTSEDAEKLRERLSKEIDIAMKQEQAKILEKYDMQTQGILENMKKERDIIRQEAENLKKLQEELEGGKFWKGKSKKKTSAVLTVATVLAWTFALASVNEVYKGFTSDEGLTFIGGLKGIVDMLLAIASTYIANKGPGKAEEEQDTK